jgi:hypothetical protein
MANRRGSRASATLRRLIGIVALLIAIVGGLATSALTGDRPSGLVAAAADALAGEQEVAYRGTVVDEQGISTAVEVAVAADGRVVADLVRHTGGSAEIRSDGTTTAVRGDADWWAWSRPGSADELAGRWFSDPPDDAVGALAPELLVPSALADVLTAPDGQWQEVGERTVAGIAGIELWDGDRFVVVTAAAPHRLLTVDVPHVRTRVAPRAFAQDELDLPEPGTIRFPRVHLDIEPSEGAVRDELAELLDPRWTQDQVMEALDALDPSKDPLVGPDGRFGSRVQAVLTALQVGSPGVDDAMTFDDARYTVEKFIRAGAFRFLERIALPQDGDGRLLNRAAWRVEGSGRRVRLDEGLYKFAKNVHSPGQIEFLQQVVLPLLRLGHAVFIEGCYSPGGDTARTTCGDAVDAGTVQQYLDRESGIPVAEKVRGIQHKHVVGLNVRQNVRKQTLQLNGDDEPVADDALKVSWLSFGPDAGGVRDDGSGIRVPLGQIKDRARVQEGLKAVNIHPDLLVDGKPVPQLLVVQTAAGVDGETGEQEAQVFLPEDVNPGDDGSRRTPRTPTSPGPAPAGGAGAEPPAEPEQPPTPLPQAGPGSPQHRPEVAKNKAPGLFGGRAGTAAEGALAAAAANPGGIDLTTLELRYLSEPEPGEGLEYSFSAEGRGPSAQAGSDLRAAALASDAFFTWLALDPSTFFVNLHPDEPDRIVDPRLGRTDAGRVLLEADLQMKKTVAALIRPDKPESGRYWDRLRRGSTGERCVPSLRHWIVPGPATVHTEQDRLYILDAPLEVHIELATAVNYETGCPGQSPAVRDHNLGVYRSVVLADLQRAVNTAPEYADLRRVYLSRIAAEWYRLQALQEEVTYGDIIGSGDATAWESQQTWSSREIYDEYVASLTKGEFDITRIEVIDGISYRVNYVYGGIEFATVTLNDIDRPAFEAGYPDLAAAAEASLDTPSTDSTGRLWLGSVTPAPQAKDSSYPWPILGYGVAAYFGAITVFAVLRHRARRVRRVG